MAVSPVAVLGGVLLDAVFSDKPSRTYEVTNKAVEDGSSIADHMQEKPAELSISGVVVGGDAASRLSRLQQIQKSRQLITYTNRIIFSQMALTKLDTEHDAEVGNGFKFNIKLRHVRRATPAQVQVTSPAPVATKAMQSQNAGTRQVQSTNKQSNNKEADERLAAMITAHRAGLLDTIELF